ncbi:MAG: cytochrome c [Cyclobacteriaceae bacterium]|nr:MAG: cytochrome c [Cyclobacteriaceae bacterium]
MVFACTPASEEESIQLPDQISYNFDIQPILSNNCYVCHGPDSSTRQAGLRLDLREWATKKLDDGKRAINPGNWKKSELINRVSSHDPEIMMPPPEMKRNLSAREIALLKHWIEQGAQWEPYWAFIKPEMSETPEVVAKSFINNEIDRFLVNKLETKELVPAELTDRYSLARRLSFVLTGLPPDPVVLEDFVNDPDSDAYEKLVDHYLDAPRFGEHWARHWMDLVRYADTRGHEFDYKVNGAWHYRDYLIRAFNQDVPYNQMVLEQLAGDMIETPRLDRPSGANESVIGTAFYCLTEGKHSPVDLRIDQSERIDNIIDVTSKTFQALTVACAKCHDHKFDPIPTTDYYSMYGMVESTRFTLTQAGFDEKRKLILDSLKRDQSSIRNYIVENLTDEPPANLKSEVELHDISRYHIIGDFRDGSLADWTPDGISISNAMGNPVVSGNLLAGLEPAKISSRAIGKGLFGVLRSPGFIISEDSMLFRAAGKNSLIRVVINNFQLIQDPIYGQLQTRLESNELQDYTIDLSMWKGHHAYIELLVGDYRRRKDKGSHEYDLDPEAWLEAAYIIGYDSLSGDVNTETVTSSITGGSTLLNKWSSGNASPNEIAALDGWLASSNTEVPGLEEWANGQQGRGRRLYDSSFVAGVTEGDHIKSPVFIRGSLKNLSSYQVPHRYLTAVSDTTKVFQNQGSGRLEFAKKVADPDNPLTARVMVNRLWHHLFGRGIVETVDNFGVQGKIPSHPELLDYLALKFMAQDWSIKKMIKFMVMSQSFQRVTTPSKSSLVVDPENVLLQHYPVRRLNAESIRDAVLAVSGRLDTTMYGPSVPIYLTEFLSGRGRPRISGPLDGKGRRSVYQAVNRNFLSPMMLAFDMPVPFSTFGRRNVSNVPSQSLTLLNDPFIVEQSKYWAAAILNQPEDFEARVKSIYLTAFSRIPQEVEIQEARAFFKEQASLLQSVTKETYGEEELWKSYCHTIFNMKEFIFLI